MPDPVATLDELPRRAARAAPDRVAIRTDRGVTMTFAELERRVQGCARQLRRLTGAGPDAAPIAVASVLDPAFAVAYYGVVRAGHIVVPVIPLLQEEQLAAQLAACGARVLIASAEVAERVSRVRDRLPGLVAVLTFDELEAGAAEPEPVPARRPGEVACIQFTSGTTGASKAVRQSHHNLVVNAAQTVAAHQLEGASVTVNHLPTYHPMHLNSALHAGATQALCTNPDPVASVAYANEVGATRYYGLPMRLSRLAADPRLPTLRFDTVRAISSGGSALPIPTTIVLADQFGIPVLQGFGLAETSPMTHCDVPDRPKTGSCGPPVEGAAARIVDLDTRAVVQPGAKGEIQVRGPQLMLGYVGEPDDAALDGEGWFSTGDLGYLDDDGYLFVVDRIKDVFKCDNWLVSPNEIERVLLEHVAVKDCAVVDRPEPFSGAVAVALLVPEPGVDPAVLARVAADVNRGLPYYQHVRHIEIVDQVPRAPSGKIQRQVLRDRFRNQSPIEKGSSS